MRIAALFLPLLSFAAPNPDWAKCKSADQCVIVKGGCGVEWAANRNFAEQTRKSPPRKDSPCKKNLETHPGDSAALCVDGKCMLNPEGRFADGKQIGDEACVTAQCWGHLGCNYLECTQKDGKKINRFVQ